MGLSDHFGGDAFRLLADGVEIPMANNLFAVIDPNKTADIDTLFIIPADVDRVELIVGRSNDATAKLPIESGIHWFLAHSIDLVMGSPAGS